MAENQIGFETEHYKEAFFTNAVNIDLSGVFHIDFIQTFYKGEGRLGAKTLVNKHQPIVMTPLMAKGFLRLLKDHVEAFERANGEIKDIKAPDFGQQNAPQQSARQGSPQEYIR